MKMKAWAVEIERFDLLVKKMRRHHLNLNNRPRTHGHAYVRVVYLPATQARTGALYMGPLNAANLKKQQKGGKKAGKGKGKGGGAGGSGEQPRGNSAIDDAKREYIFQVSGCVREGIVGSWRAV